MRRIKRPFQVLTAVLLLATVVGRIPVVSVAADTASAPSLVISQFKITSANGQFITLYNATNTTLDMGKYQLEYFNNYDLTKATSSKLISLTGSLPPHGYYMVNDSALVLCYQLTIDSVSLGLSSTAGMVEVLAYNQATPILQDYVGWSKTAASGAQTLPSNTSAFLQRLPVDAANNPFIGSPGGGSWQAVQPSSTNACDLVTGNTSTPVQTGLSQLLPGIEPAATIIGQVDDGTLPVSLPASDIGLMAPLITEILPNPAGSGNDAVDEFIEIYNPNVVAFDISGFDLQAGSTTMHDFAFANSTSLPPQSFTAFYAGTTHLSLSNSGGQVKLLDPSGNAIAATAVYGTANDGQAWALANGKWYWTTELTPGEPNIIKQPPAKPAKAKSTSSKTNKTKATSTKTAKAAKVKKTKKVKTSTALSGSADTATTTSPIHSSTLAVIVGLALLYGVYEYRHDLANRFHQLKRHIKPGTSNRP